MTQFDDEWGVLEGQYIIQQMLGQGSFGTVASAIHVETGTEVAIKMMSNTFKDIYNAKKIISEIEILRKLSEIDGNCFTIQIYDIIFPEFDVESADEVEYIFIVMEYEETDLCHVLN